AHPRYTYMTKRDESPLEPSRAAGYSAHPRPQNPAGARFRGGEHEPLASTEVEQRARRFRQLLIHHQSCSLHGSRTVALANAARPSPRPVNPIFSLVVAFTPTRSIGIPAISAMRARIASR